MGVLKAKVAGSWEPVMQNAAGQFVKKSGDNMTGPLDFADNLGVKWPSTDTTLFSTTGLPTTGAALMNNAGTLKRTLMVADPTANEHASTRKFVTDRFPNQLSFSVGIIGDGTAGWPQWTTGQYQVAYLALSPTGGAFAAAVDVLISSGYNYTPAMGRMTRRTDFYWDGARNLYMTGDLIVDSSNSTLPYSYGIGKPFLGNPGDDYIYWPIYKVATEANDPVSVDITITSPGQPGSSLEAIKSRFALFPTVDAYDHGYRSYSFGATPWIEPALLNGWNSGGFGRPFLYRRTSDGVVQLTGHVAGGAPANSTIVVLPPGFRPKYQGAYPISNGSGLVSNCFVMPTGNVEQGANPSSVWAALDPVMFLAEIV